MSRQEEIAQQQQLLKSYRQTLAHYLGQLAAHGSAYAPPVVTHGIREARDEIGRIKTILRGWGVIDDHPDDEEQKPATPPLSTTPAQPAAQTDPHTTAKPRPQSKPRNKATDDGLPNDVYISYHPADKAWVRNTLLPQLEEAGLRVIVDYRDFAIGVPKLVNIEQAVDQSRHTLIVMTPEWVTGEWEDFQALLAATSDPAGRRGKLLPLMLKSCVLPTRLNYLTPTDFTDPAERDEQMGRLLRGLLPQTPPAKSRPKTKQDQQPSATAQQPQSAGAEPDRQKRQVSPPEDLNATDLDELASILVKSGRADYAARKALCIRIQVDSSSLPFVDQAASADFAQQLIHHLHQTDNIPALLRLCDVMNGIVQGRLATQLATIRAKIVK